MHAPQTQRRQSAFSAVLQTAPLSFRNQSKRTVWQCLALVMALIGWTTTASASEYTIQVGAFKSPSQSYADNLRSFGEVNTAQSSSGVTVFTVGRYNSVDEAKGDLNRIADQYPGAFVRNMPASARSADIASSTSSAAAAPAAAPARKARSSSPDTQLWESLSESERRRVVYLDGVLHLKQGDQFVPLDEYRRSQGQ